MARLLATAALRALLVVALPVVVVVWLLYSTYFTIERVDVDGGARVSAAWVEAELRPLVGRHVLAVSLEAVRRRLSSHPWVASVELRRELPNRLRVAVVERKPVALLRTGDDFTFLDAEGLPIAPCPPEAPARTDARQKLLVLSTPTHAALPPVPVQAALDVVGELRRAHPAWGVGAQELEILGEGEYRVQTAALPYPLLVRAGSVGEAIANLQLALPEIGRRFTTVEELDLRQPRRLVVRAVAGDRLPNPNPLSLPGG